MRASAWVIAMLALALGACGAPARPAEPDETTESWTSGDDEALGIDDDGAE